MKKIFGGVIALTATFLLGMWYGSNEMPRQDFLDTTYACHKAHMFYTPALNKLGQLTRVKCVFDKSLPPVDVEAER